MTRVAPGIVLDSRRALYCAEENWLAVADLHFGWERSARAAGMLVPEWGMEEVEARLHKLLHDYRPAKLVICGDLVESRASALAAIGLLERLRTRAAEERRALEIIVIAGNHDRRCLESPLTREWHLTEKFCFYHGDRPAPAERGTRTAVIGHFHPAIIMRDGGGVKLKLPLFVQDGALWTLPAFSPWASGMQWDYPAGARLWAMTKQRVLAVRPPS